MRFTNLPPRAAQHVGAASAAPAASEHAEHTEQASGAIPVLLGVPQPGDTVSSLHIDALGLCSVERAGQIIGVDASLIRRYCRTGKLPAVRVDGVWVLLERDVRTYAARPRRRGRPASS